MAVCIAVATSATRRSGRIRIHAHATLAVAPVPPAFAVELALVVFADWLIVVREHRNKRVTGRPYD